MLPTNTAVKIVTGKSVPASAEAVVAFVAQRAKPGPLAALGEKERAAVARLLSGDVVSGKLKELAFDLVESGGGAKGKLRRVYVVGVGPAEKATGEIIRQAAGHLARALRKHRVQRVAVTLPGLKTVDDATAAEAIASGLLLASFRFSEFKGAAQKKEDESALAKAIEVMIVPDASNVRRAVERAVIIADAQNYARTIASRPGNVINPPSLAKVAQELAKEVGLKCRVLDEKEMTRLGMGGILAVGGGSATPPRMIVLEHRGPKSKSAKPLLVVGKSITFDTGGISIKPADKMGEMVFDKCGGMAVLGLMCAAAKLKLPGHLVGILSSAENMPGSRAYRPGDLLTMYNGVTVEVTNTDAEGRLVLGDALAWGIETFKPSAVVDLATLTGGVVVALGTTMAGAMSNSDALMKEIQSAADAAGENIWRLPVGDDQRDQIKSHFADIINAAGRQASALTAGAFLSYFVPRDDSVPWVHLDIAGVADIDKEWLYYARGATGWGVRTLVEWVSSKA